MRLSIWTPPSSLYAPPLPHVNAMKLQRLPILDCIDIIVNNDDICIEHSLYNLFLSHLWYSPLLSQVQELKDPIVVQIVSRLWQSDLCSTKGIQKMAKDFLRRQSVSDLKVCHIVL